MKLTAKQLSLFGLIFLLATGVRFAGLTFDSLWLDESYQTLVGAYGHGAPDFLSQKSEPYRFAFSKPASVPEMLGKFRQVDPLCPPLHAVLLNRWLTLWGDSDIAVRSFSVVCSLLSLVIVFAIATALFGAEAGLLAALVQALSPFDVHYAQEARMYSLVVLTSSLSTGTLLWLLRGFPRQAAIQAYSINSSEQAIAPKMVSAGVACSANTVVDDHRGGAHSARPAAAGSFVMSSSVDHSSHQLSTKSEMGTALAILLAVSYGVFASALINSHYTGLFVACFQALLAVCWMLVTRRWKLFALLVLAAIVAVAAWLPWLPMFLQSASARKESFYVSRESTFIWPFYALFVRIPVNWEVFLSGPRVGGYAIPVYVTSALTLLASLWLSVRTALAGVRRSPMSQTGRGADPLTSQQALLTVWAWALVPASILWFMDVLEGRKVVEIARYTIGSAPAVYILAGAGLLFVARKWRLGCLLLAFHAAFASANLFYLHTVHQREPWKEMAIAVEKVCRPDDLLLVSEYYDVACLDRYLTRPFKQWGVSPAMGREHIESILKGRHRFALLTAQQGEFIKDLIPAEYKIVDRVDMRHGLHLRIYQK